MKKILLILILQNLATGHVQCQSFTVNELINLAYTSSKNIDHYMNRKGFVLSWSSTDSGTTRACFIEKTRSKKSIGPKRSIDIYINKDDSKYFTLHTPVLNEYLEGEQRLIKSRQVTSSMAQIQK